MVEEKEKKVFNLKNCPYGFKRAACEDLCTDYKKCVKDEYKGRYPFSDG